MATARVDVVFQGVSGLPKDQYVNVWYFNGAPGVPAADVAGQAFGLLNQFYHITLGSYLSPAVGTHVNMTAYDMAAATPRPIINTAVMTMSAFPGTALPEEVALCLSYYTDRNLPSHRGRIYLGPLNNGAMSGSPSRPVTALRSAMAAAGRDLIQGVTSSAGLVVSGPVGIVPGIAWALHSVKLGTFIAIAHGWVDDAFDTQRRRGCAPTTRTIYSAVLP